MSEEIKKLKEEIEQLRNDWHEQSKIYQQLPWGKARAVQSAIALELHKELERKSNQLAEMLKNERN